MKRREVSYPADALGVSPFRTEPMNSARAMAALEEGIAPENGRAADPGMEMAQATAPPSFRASLRYLKDSINEVVFANYFLCSYERELREIAPPSLGVPLEARGPETPAERADRLLQAHATIIEAVQKDLARIQPAVAKLKSCGIADLEEGVVRSRRLLAEEFIAPNLEVLSMDQDGGIVSPFKGRAPDEIIALLMEEPRHDEQGMHEAERVLRSCPAVRELQRDFRKLMALRADPASKEALEEARHAADGCARTWGMASPVGNDAASFGAHLSTLTRLHAELDRKHARLAELKPRLAAHLGTRDGLGEKVRPSVQSLLEGEPTSDIASLFEEGMPLDQLARQHGLLPVAQVVRELVAATIDAGGGASSLDPSVRPEWDQFPDAISAFIRQRVQSAMCATGSVGAGLTQLAVALCNRGLAEELKAVASRLGQVPERERHEVLNGPEAARRLQEMLSRAETRLSVSAEAPGQGSLMSNGVATLFAGLGRRMRSEEWLVDAAELDAFLETTLDYLRRRHAFQEQAAARAAYVERGWTARSRQRRMEKPLGDEKPTLLELSQIDAELTEVFHFIQDVAECFPHSEESPLTSILSTLAATEKEVRDSIADASESLREQLADPRRSPVIAELIPLMERLRQNQPGGEPRGDTIAALAGEITRIADLAAQCEPPVDAEAALGLCRKTSLAPLELAGLVTSEGKALPLCRYLGAGFQIDAA
jgi:hypothetical protein